MIAVSAFVRSSCPNLRADSNHLAMSLPDYVKDLEKFMVDPVNMAIGELIIVSYMKDKARSCREIYSKYGSVFLRVK